MTLQNMLRLSVLVLALGLGETARAGQAADALKTNQPAYALTTTPRQAIAQIAKMGKVKIEVDWQELQRAEANLTDKVVVKGKNATLAQVLELLLAQIAAPRKPLSYYIEDETIHVTTQSRVISRRTRAALAGSPQPRQAGTAAPQADRTGRIGQTLNFDQVPLSDVVQYFRTTSGLNIHVNWRSLQAVGIDKSAPVTFKASGISLATALDLMLDGVNANKDKFARAYWVVDDGMVKIATGEVFNQDMRTVVFDIADLLAVTPNFKARRFKLDDSGTNNNQTGTNGGTGVGTSLWGDDDDDDDDDDDALRTRQQDKLVETIKNSIGEDMWQPTGKGAIKVLAGRKQMVITQSLLGFKLMRQTLGR